MHRLEVRESGPGFCAPLSEEGSHLHEVEVGSLEGSERGFTAAATLQRQLSSAALLLLLVMNFN